MQKSGRLELTWAGKSYETESFEPRLLVEDKEKSYGDDSPNMLIHGDNLLALKALELDYKLLYSKRHREHQLGCDLGRLCTVF